MAAGYLVVDVQVSDPEQFKHYQALAPAAVAAAGGEYVVRGGRSEALEGDWLPQRTTVVRFPSYEQAKAFYNSEPYRAARAKRTGATAHFNMVLVEGV